MPNWDIESLLREHERIGRGQNALARKYLYNNPYYQRDQEYRNTRFYLDHLYHTYSPWIGRAAFAGASYLGSRVFSKSESSDTEMPGPYSTPKRKRITYGPRKALHQSSVTTGSLAVYGKENQVRKYQKPLIRKNFALGNTATLYDMISPPLTIYNKGFIPTSMSFDGMEDAPRYTLPETIDGVAMHMTGRSGRLFNLEDISGISPYEWSPAKAIPTGINGGLKFIDAAGKQVEGYWDPERPTPGIYKTIDSDAGFTIVQFPVLTGVEAHNYITKASEMKPVIHQDERKTVGQIQDWAAQTGHGSHSQDTLTPSYFTNLQVTDIDSYGALESFKMTFTFSNPNEVNMIFEIMQVCPKEGLIADLWGDQNTHYVAHNTTFSNGDPNPLNMLRKDWQEHVKTINERLSATTASNYYPRPLQNSTNLSEKVHNTRFEDAKISGWAKNFNKYYKIHTSKNMVLKPGGRCDFDVVIPGFGYRFNKYCMQIGSTTSEAKLLLKEIYSTFTRFLLVKFKSVLVHEDISNPQDQTLGHQVVGKLCRTELKLGVMAKKYFKARFLPRYHKVNKMETGGSKDIDWLGPMRDVDMEKCIDYHKAIHVNQATGERQALGSTPIITTVADNTD